MNTYQKQKRHNTLTARYQHRAYEQIETSAELPHGQKCLASGHFYHEDFYLYSPNICYFSHRAGPVPKLYSRWKEPTSRTIKCWRKIRQILTKECRKSRTDTLLLTELSPYEDQARRKPERNWKSHRNTQWKPKKNL